jgi:hypothetical protein
MPSALHRGIIDLLRRDLSIVAELVCRVLGVPLPRGLDYEERDGRLVAYSFVKDPREIQADLVVLARHADVPGRPPHIVTTLEAQLRRDNEKRFRLLEYIAAARRDHRCSGLSSLFSPDADVIEEFRAMFAAEPHFCPVLVGPSAVPIILTVEEAIQRPTLATLSAIVHANGEHGPAIIAAVIESWHYLEAPSWHADARVLWSCIPENIMNKLSNIIRSIGVDRAVEATEWWEERDGDDDDGEPGEWEKRTGLYTRAQRAGRENGLQEGEVAGLRRSLDLVLKSRGLILSDLQRATIDACTAVDVLERWIVLAATVTSVAELLDA